MTINELLDLLTRIVKLITAIENYPDFAYKEEIIQRLNWTAKNLADRIWKSELGISSQ